MNYTTDPKDATNQPVQEEKSKDPERTKQQQTDPNITELKGLTDPNEDLEPKDTDNNID